MAVHLPCAQAASISSGAPPLRAFRQGGVRLLRHPVDAVCGPSRARGLARGDPGRADSATGSLHCARREDRRQGDPRSPRGRRACAKWREPKDSRFMASFRMGVIPTIAPFLLPAMLPRLRSEWPDLKLYLREETSSAACEALHRGQLDCVLLALPFNCGEVDSALLFDDPLYVAFPPGEAPRGRLGRGREDRREPPAPARGWPLPQGSCAFRLQPARDPRQRLDDGHIAAHARADGRQRARSDLRARGWRSRPAYSTAPRWMRNG